MQITLLCKPGYQRDKQVFDQMKEVLSQMGHLADERPSEPRVGYLAERPLTMPNCIRIWAPCNCCWTYLNASTSVLSQCEDDKAPVFDYVEAEVALRALLDAEEAQKKIKEGESGGESTGKQLAIVPVPKA